MNATHVSSEVSKTLGPVTQHLAALAQASARCQDVLTRTWSLRQRAAILLLERIDAIRKFEGLPVSNPDAIFLNRMGADGSLSTMAMTDVLIDVARREEPVLDAAGGVFCSRHDSIDPAYAFTPGQNQTLTALINEFAGSLMALTVSDLNEFWRREIADPADAQRTDTPARLLIELHRIVLQSEIALLGDTKPMSTHEQTRLTALLEADAPRGVFALSWMTADQTVVPMPSVYCVSAVADGEEQPSGAVFLVMPGRGIEPFESVDVLREALSHRLTQNDANHGLREAMLLVDQARLRDLEAVDPLAWTFQALSAPLLDAHVQALEHKQTEDLQFVLQGGASSASVDAFIEQFDQVSTCAHLDDAMGHRFSSLAARMEIRVQPHWRKYADEEKQQELAELEDAYDQRRECVEERLDGLQSLERFAHDQIHAYMRHHLGCLIDPVKVQVSYEDVINLGKSEPLKTTYKKSLLEFAVQGAPASADLTFSPVPPRLHAEFSSVFVRNMLEELNLARRYAQTLAQRYAEDETLRLLAAHRDSAIALGACAALMQGHMVQDRSHMMLQMIRGDKGKEGSVYSMGSLHLARTDTRFADVIVFVERNGSDEHWVLYAPGAPGGQDFHEYGSWRQLTFGVGQWLATDAGQSYVNEQLAGPGERVGRNFIDNILLKPTQWTPDSCVFVPCTKDKFQSNLSDLVARKASLVVKTAERLAPQGGVLADYANPSVLAFVEARIEAINAEFVRPTPQLVPFTDYVHQEASAALNDHLRRHGYSREIDPDTLYLGLGIPYSDTPDFSEHSSLHSFTQLIMYGAEDILSYRPALYLYSSTGLDVTELPVNIFQFLDRQIREADLGARYMTLLQREFLLHDNPLYGMRKALLAKRVQYEMIQGALKAYLQGGLDEQQYTWLRQTISGFEKGRKPLSEQSRICSFKIAGQVIEGVHILRDFDTEEQRFNLLYTPHSPDGIYFRPLTDYSQVLESPAMQNYCYARVAYKSQRLVGTFLDNFERGMKHDPDFIRIEYDIYDAISSADRLYTDMLVRLIEDIDALTDSTAEKRLLLAWNIIRWTGTIVLLPFPAASFTWGVVTSGVSLARGVDAYRYGDRATALPLLIFGVIGVMGGADAARALATGSSTVLASTALKSGLWVLYKLDRSGIFRRAA